MAKLYKILIIISMEFEQEKFATFIPKDLKDQKDKTILKDRFVQSFIVYVQNYFNSQNSQQNKYKLRQGIFNMKCMDAMTQIRYNGRSQTTSRPPSFDRCARITTCVRYHMFDIGQVYDKIVENKGVFKCPECEAIGKETKEIVPDYLSYLYYQCTDGVSIDVVIQREDIVGDLDQDKKTEIYETENKVIKANKIITMVFNNYSPMFRKIIQGENKNIENNYKKIRSQINSVNIRASQLARNNSTFSSMNNTSINLVSLITGKRIRAGVMHESCKHTEIYIFDLEGLILSLFQYTRDGIQYKPKQSVRCIFCKSEFTAQNILQKAVFFGRIFDIITKLPFASGKAYYESNTLQPRKQESIIKAKERLTTKYPNKKIDSALREMSRGIVGFWNKQEREKYERCINRTFETVKTKIGTGFRKTIDYNKIFYPVRCIKCKSLDFVDVWDELIHFVQLKELETTQDYRCLTCKQNEYDEDEPELQNSIYLDLEVYTLMQHNLLNIVFNPIYKKWLPDIHRIQFKPTVRTEPVEFVINYLEVNHESFSFQSFPYYKNNFVIKTKINQTTYCFLLRQCMQERNNLQTLIQHVVYFDKSKNQQFELKCPKCGNIPQTIFSVKYDSMLTMNLRAEYGKWNSQLHRFQKYSRIKIVDDGASLNELQFLKQTYAQFCNSLPQTADQYKMNNQGWSIEEVEWAGGVHIFNQHKINYLPAHVAS